MRTRFLGWVLAAIGLLAPVTAQATSLAISNIRFSEEVGNDKHFKWSVEWASDLALDLKVGEEANVIYGALIINDLPIPPSNARDGNNSFQVEFELSPAKVRVSVQGSPRAQFSPGPVSVSVDFDNRPQSFLLGDGREILLTFLDSSHIENSGFFLLSAKIQLISEPRPVDRPLEEEVIEPMTSAPEQVNFAGVRSDLMGLETAKDGKQSIN